MPYITREQRKAIDPALTALAVEIIKLRQSGVTNIDGVLNYSVTRLIQGTMGDTSYAMLPRFTGSGMLECCKLEFYRRLVAPYEDKKARENGDVY